MENTEEIILNQQFKLDNFEGPLDLLLHLIKEAKLDIKTVKIALITNQFLAYMEDISSLDLTNASEFIDMAATLLEIKSRSLLPVTIEDDTDDEDPEAMLLKRLQEYQLFKEASETLRKLEDIDKFYKNPEPEAHDFRYVLKDIHLEGLLDAFAGILQRAEQSKKVIEPKVINKDRYTVDDKIFSIRTVISKKKTVKFTDLFEDDYSRAEIITTFMALLELIKNQVVTINQSNIYGEIMIEKTENGEEVHG